VRFLHLIVGLVAACEGTTTGPPPAAGGGGAGGEGGAGGSGGVEVVEPVVTMPESGLRPGDLGILVNAQDPQSVAVANYYQAIRGIPESQVYVLDFPPQSFIGAVAFEELEAELEDLVPESVQAYVITWTQPWQVECMSVTSAFALGFDFDYCGGCGPSKFVDYFDSRSLRPYDDHGIRPTMMLAASNLDEAIALIDRGVASDDTHPRGDGYFIRTVDSFRSLRWPQYVESVEDIWTDPDGLSMYYVDNSSGIGSDFIADTQNILFYFTGLFVVPSLETNTYVPGAVADHFGMFFGFGDFGFGPTSALSWLRAGVTASYGTIFDPCGFTSLFPDATVMAPAYFRGATVLEAYWKSVAMPGEGIFAGEPLARPWGSDEISWSDGTLTIATTHLEPGERYELVADDGLGGSDGEVVLGDIHVDTPRRTTIVYGPTTAPHYTLRRSE
jgi:uncharacterized protein (TIGR03790 family)